MNPFISNSPAFHQDPFGEFTWPPRSYTCSFCRREFRSAQALGGHMNVHRRDRARLNQSSPPPPQAGTETLRHQEPASSGTHRPQLSPAIFRNEGRDGGGDLTEIKLSAGMGSVERGDDTCKRHKKTGGGAVSSPLPFLHSKVCSGERCSGDSSMEDIDLELRLGNPPAVN